METFLLTVAITSAILGVIIVLMQPPKSDSGLGGLSSSLSSSNSFLGVNQDSFLTKATWVLLIIFISSCIALKKTQESRTNTTIQKVDQVLEKQLKPKQEDNKTEK